MYLPKEPEKIHSFDYFEVSLVCLRFADARNLSFQAFSSSSNYVDGMHHGV